MSTTLVKAQSPIIRCRETGNHSQHNLLWLAKESHFHHVTQLIQNWMMWNKWVTLPLWLPENIIVQSGQSNINHQTTQAVNMRHKILLIWHIRKCKLKNLEAQYSHSLP
jgi:hypothetical protein